MKKENLIQEIGKPILMPLGFIQLFLFFIIALSPFIWIWKSWELCYKTFLTGLIGAILIGIIHKGVKYIIGEIIENEEKKIKEAPTKEKSKFQQRIDELKK